MPNFQTIQALLAVDQSTTSWLPMTAIIAGVAMLGLLAGLLIRGRLNSAESTRVRAEFAAQAQVVQRQLGEARSHALELGEIAEEWKRRLTSRITRMEDMLTRAQRPTAARTRPAPAPPAQQPRQHARAIIEPKPNITADPLMHNIYTMADVGRSPVQIARQLNEQVGKIELILALRKAS